MKVIVADDSMFARSIIIKAIKPEGYVPFEATNGQEVIDILEEKEKDIGLILLDWNMPVMDGLEVLKNVKNDNRFSSIPVIMLTSESDDKNMEIAFEAGVKGYIAKPFTSDELVLKIKNVLEQD